MRPSMTPSTLGVRCMKAVRCSSASTSTPAYARAISSHLSTASLPKASLTQSPNRPSLPTTQPNPLKQSVAFYRTAGQPPKEWQPPTDAAGVHKYLLNLLPNLEFPEKLALRMVTHSSWKGGIEGNNARLAFLGRRVLDSYLHLFLFSASAQGSVQDIRSPENADNSLNYQKVAKKSLNAQSLGAHVGRAWQTEQVLRWVSAAPGPKGNGAQSGLDTVAGTVVEAIMGGIFHQFGGSVAHRVFHTRVLPHLKPNLPKPVHGYIDEICLEMGGLNAVVSEQTISGTLHSTVSGQNLLRHETPRKAAAAGHL